MVRHVPRAQASPEEIVLRAEVIHPPLAFTGDPLLCLFRIGLIVRYDELDVTSCQTEVTEHMIERPIRHG